MLKWRNALKRGKLNNKAMTLIEVIVAMAILAVVITPTLRMFATSSGTNLRAKHRQRATTVGESVMESFKAYTVEALCQQFDIYKNFKGVRGTADMGVEAFYSADRTSGAGSSALHANETLREDAQAFRFWVNNALADGGSVYDIDIWVEPKSNPDVVNFEAPNKYSDAFIQIGENDITSGVTRSGIFTELKTKASDSVLAAHSTYTIDDVELSKVKRVIDIAINDDGTNQTVTEKITFTAEAKVTYHYTTGVVGAPPVSGSVDVTDPTVMTYEVEFEDGGTKVKEYTVYDNSATIAGQNVKGKICKLNNVYLYYFPAYEEIYGDNAEDEINVTAHLTSLYANGGSDPKGEGYEPMKMIIARQITTGLTDSDLSSEEVTYDYNVNCTLNGGGQLDLLHNYGEKLKENFTGVPTAPGGRVSGFSSMQPIKDGILDTTNLIYDVRIEVYQAGTGRTDQLALFTGTINE